MGRGGSETARSLEHETKAEPALHGLVEILTATVVGHEAHIPSDMDSNDHG